MTIPTNNVALSHLPIHSNRIPTEYGTMNMSLPAHLSALGFSSLNAARGKCGIYACLLKAHPNNWKYPYDHTGTYYMTPFGTSPNWANNSGAWDNYYMNIPINSGYKLTPASSLPTDISGSGPYTIELYFFGSLHDINHTNGSRNLIFGSGTNLFVDFLVTDYSRYKISLNSGTSRLSTSPVFNPSTTAFTTSMHHLAVMCNPSASGNRVVITLDGVVVCSHGAAVSFNLNEIFIGYPSNGPHLMVVDFRVANRVLYNMNGFAPPLAASNRWQA